MVRAGVQVSAPMRNLLLAVFAAAVMLMLRPATDSGDSHVEEMKDRRARAAKTFSDGVLLLHARDADSAADSYREDPAFYYLSGLENSPGALVAIDGKSGQSWLFLPTAEPDKSREMQPGPGAVAALGIEHVVDWSELESLMAQQANAGARIYYQRGAAQLPERLAATRDAAVPAWLQLLKKKWSSLDLQPVGKRLNTLMAVESTAEQEASRAAARSTIAAVLAGLKAVRPGVTQRTVERVVANACWNSGAHGVSFWPWVMSGPNSIFPKPFESDSRYDHLDSVLRTDDLVRLDVGCEWEHYQGDLGRTVPVSGRYSDEQREIWNAFVDAYLTASKLIRNGNTEAQVFEAWKNELARHRDLVKTALAKQAIESWSERQNVRHWQMHTMNLDAGYIEGPLRTGMVIDFEPMASIGGQGYYLEDMFLVEKDGATLLTPGVPYTAEEIEAAMGMQKEWRVKP